MTKIRVEAENPHLDLLAATAGEALSALEALLEHPSHKPGLGSIAAVLDGSPRMVLRFRGH